MSAKEIITIVGKNGQRFETHSNIIGKAILSPQVLAQLGNLWHVNIQKKGYETIKTTTSFDGADTKLNLVMKKIEPTPGTIADLIHFMHETINVATSDFLLFVIVAITVAKIYYQGIVLSIPFVIISLLLSYFWFVYILQFWKFFTDSKLPIHTGIAR